jgi:hypothetical protein
MIVFVPKENPLHFGMRFEMADVGADLFHGTIRRFAVLNICDAGFEGFVPASVLFKTQGRNVQYRPQDLSLDLFPSTGPAVKEAAPVAMKPEGRER